MKSLITIVISITFAGTLYGQNCTCESNFEWVKKTFEENDAGFQYILDKKGQNAYDIHNQLIMEKIRTAKNLNECTGFLYEWTKFFRSGHVGIGCLTCEPPISQTTNEVSVYDTLNVDISQFQKYISEKEEVSYEGVWVTGSYKIGIKKEGENYIGFIIESDVETWQTPGLVKLKIERNGNSIKSTYYMRNHSPVESGEPNLTGNNYMQIGDIILKRLTPHFPEDKFADIYFKSLDSKSLYLEEINPTTLYFRIPSFEYKEKQSIDKLISSNKKKILKTEKLIIDIRNNGGGSDNSWNALLPLICTNQVYLDGVEFLSTELNNQLFLNMIKDRNFLVRMWGKNKYKKLQSRLGEFVNLHNDTVFTYVSKVNEYPKNIGIIINKGCGSATEQFLLFAKQSKKVKLFGTNTFGCLDISNLISVDSPCKEIRLWYCLSRSLRIPHMVIDDIGLQPDLYIDETIPQHKWVEYVLNEMENNKWNF
jgi:hypothetical protein